MIFCACDADKNDEISEEEIKDEDCVAIQQSIFHDNYLTKAGFYLDVLTLDDAKKALTGIINDPIGVYNKFFNGDNGKIITGVIWNSKWNRDSKGITKKLIFSLWSLSS